MTSPETPADLDGKLWVVANPASTELKRTAMSADELAVVFGNRVQLFWTAKDKSATQAKLAETLEAGDIVLTGGGDGTDHMFVEMLIAHPDLDEALRQTPMLSLYGGNANMGPGQLTPRRARRTPSPKKVLQAGQFVDVHPLHSVIDHEDEPSREFIAAYFLGIGATGLAAEHLDNVRQHSLRKFKPTRWIPDGVAIASALKSAPVFTVQQQGQELDVYEVSMVNGDRMAKFGRFNTNLSDPEFFVTALSDKRVGKVASDLGRFATRRLPGHTIDTAGGIQLSVHTDSDRELWAHVDGEPHRVSSGSTVTVHHHPQTFRAITTNPKLH